jgi:hypothetical protein
LTAESCVFIQVRWALLELRLTVDGIALLAGMADLLSLIAAVRIPADRPG